MTTQDVNLDQQLEKASNWNIKYEVGKTYNVDGVSDVFVEETTDDKGLPVYRFKNNTTHFDFVYLIKNQE